MKGVEVYLYSIVTSFICLFCLHVLIYFWYLPIGICDCSSKVEYILSYLDMLLYFSKKYNFDERLS